MARPVVSHDPTQHAFADFALLSQARLLWNQGAVEAALQAFETARRSEPTSIRARLEFARALAQLYEIRAAEQLLAEARGIAADEATLLAAIAPIYRQIYRPRIARDLLADLWQRDALTPPALSELAVVYETFGQVEEAIEAIDQVVASAPDQAEPRLLRARLARRTGNTALAEQTLNYLVSMPALTPSLLAQAWAELAQLLDEQGDYQAATDAATASKAAAERLSEVARLRNHSSALQHTFARLYASLTESHVRDWRRSDLPAVEEAAGFVQLIGFPRSGTTLLEQMLAAHPQLFVSSERALFSGYIFPAACRSDGRERLSLEALLHIPIDQLIQSRRRYVACSQAIEGEAMGGRIHLDKNPNHTSLAAGLLRLFPESKFLFVIRDPRDVIISTYFRFFPLSEFSVNFLKLEDLVELYLAETHIWQQFRDLIGGQWIEVRYEELVADFRKEVRRSLEFLEIAWTDDVEHYRRRLAQKPVNSPSHDVVRRSIYTSAIGRWQNYESLLAPVMHRMMPVVHRLGYD